MNHTLIVVSILSSVGSGLRSGLQVSIHSLEVRTKYGTVRGGIGESRDGRSFYKFLGIPYAKAERFEAPVEPDTWAGVRDATALGNMCPQFPADFDETEEKYRVFAGNEDCLNVNVYTPKLPGERKQRLPVLIWFPSGGGDIGGAPIYDNPYFMDTDIIVVTFNSRIGFLGYLNLGFEQASGNQKLKDQVMMLKWVQKNIRDFGGDPKRVTIGGVDSGAAEVSYHLISPMSKGLFSGAISQSATFRSPYMFIRDPIYQGKKYGEFVGCPTDSRYELLACLKTKKVKKLILSFHRLVNLSPTEFLQFGPSIEQIEAEKAFLTESPIVALNEGRVSNKVPWLVGSGDHYGLLPVVIKMLRSDTYRKQFSESFKSIMPNFFDYRVSAEEVPAFTKKLSDNFLGGEVEVNAENMLEVEFMVRLRQFTGPLTETASIYHKIAPVYAYQMKYSPVHSLTHSVGYNRSFPGTCNDELSFMFPTHPYYPGIQRDSKDYEFSKKFVNLIASFVENRKPTKAWDIEWLPFDEASFFYGIDEKATQHVPPPKTKKALEFWAEMHQSELKRELQNPPNEIF